MAKSDPIRRLENELGLELTDLADRPDQQKIIARQALIAAWNRYYDDHPDAPEPPPDDAVQAGAELLQEAALARMRMSVCRNCFLADAGGRLIALNLCDNALADFPFERAEDWAALRVLFLAGNRLSRAHLGKGLRALQWLDLSDNPDLRALRFSAPLPALEALDASDSGLEQIEFPAGCSSLKTLDLSRNKLETAVFKGDCPALEWLDLSGNRLLVFTLPTGFQNLQNLFLTQNKGLKTLKFDQPLAALNTLHLKGCALDELPPDLLRFKALQSLYLYGNPLPGMQDVVSGNEYDNSWKAVYHYLNTQTKGEGHQLMPLLEAKLILVGNGEVGKTSISLKLRDREAELPAPGPGGRTPALSIDPYVLKSLPPEITEYSGPIDEFRLNIWDFGGQGKYREIQQLFCSRKSLYLFVTAFDDLPTKEDYVGFDYWLSMISGFGFDENTQHSPVIYVVNKIDTAEKDVEEASLKAAFPNILKVIKVSCKTKERLDELEEEIRKRLKHVSPDIFTARFPENWLAVKNTLESRKKEHVMTRAEYLRLCREEHEIAEEEEALSWLEILDRIGVVIYLGKHPRLSEKIILDPDWLKDAIVQVIDSGEDDDGIIKKKDFRKIWEAYPSELEEDFIQWLLAYQICFEQTDERGRPEYVVPALLPAAAPQLPAYLEGPAVHRFRLVFDPFFPAGTVNKLMVRIKNRLDASPDMAGEEARMATAGKVLPPAEVEIFHPYFWNKNVILRDHRHNAYAHVWEDWNEKSVCIDLLGEPAAHEDFLRFVEHAVQQLNGELKSARKIYRLDFITEVWRHNHWKNLKFVEEEGAKVFEIRPPERKQRGGKLRCFVSYAHADDNRYVRCFIEGIKVHSDWEVFDDRGIPLGADWNAVLQAEVEKCDFGIYLLSQRFIKSEYIREKEFGKFVERQNQEGFPFFGVLLSTCAFEGIQEVAKRQFFAAFGQDYGLAENFRDQQITFTRLVAFNHRGEVLPNEDREVFFRKFVEKANEVLKGIHP